MREILFKAKGQTDDKWHIGFLANLYGGICIIRENEHEWICKPETISQCTGLKDKNGNLIWENDVVKHDFGKDQIGVQLAIVKYDSKYACYQIKPIFDWMYCDKSDCEVIGNIFDNPELLEVGCGQELDWGEEK